MYGIIVEQTAVLDDGEDGRALWARFLVAQVHSVPAVDGVRSGVDPEAGIREMLFPDTWVIIRCSVWLRNRDCVVETRVYSAS
jgi:hypothetical protein